MTRDTTYQRHLARSTARAYTLTELLFAIFILGIGLAMSAALFPTAMRENEMSFNDVTGTIICNNALAIAQTFLRAEDLEDPKYDNLTILADESDDHKDLLSHRAQHDLYGQEYTQSPDPVRGFVLLGKRLSNEDKENRCLLVAVAYTRRNDDRKVRLKRVEGDAWLYDREPDGDVVQALPRFKIDKVEGNNDPDLKDVPIGSPLIVQKQDGTVDFAKIVSRVKDGDGVLATLDRDLSDGADSGSPKRFPNAFVVVLEGEKLVSPAMATVISETALQRREP